MMILAINLNNSLVDNLAVLAIFIPIIIINIIAYFSQKEKQKELLKPKRKPRKKHQLTDAFCVLNYVSIN